MTTTRTVTIHGRIQCRDHILWHSFAATIGKTSTIGNIIYQTNVYKSPTIGRPSNRVHLLQKCADRLRIILEQCETTDDSHCAIEASLSHLESPIFSQPYLFLTIFFYHVHHCAGLVNILGFANLSLVFRLTSTITSTVLSERINNDFGVARLPTKIAVGVGVFIYMTTSFCCVYVSREIFEFCESCLIAFLFSSSCVELLLPSRAKLLQAAASLRGQHLLHGEHAHGEAHRSEHDC